MGRSFVQIVTGPAGSGKSTYCHTLQQHCATLLEGSRSITGGRRTRAGGRHIHVANLDPAAENFLYDVAFDIRDLITVEEVMEELHLGPNGALVYCMEYLLDNLDWLRDELDNFDGGDSVGGGSGAEEAYLLLDCPGQVELYTHIPVMRRIIDAMRQWGYSESSMVSVCVLDATFVCDASKFVGGSLLGLSVMISMELPHINVLTKCDLVDGAQVERILDVESASELWAMETDRQERELRRLEQVDGGMRVDDVLEVDRELSLRAQGITELEEDPQDNERRPNDDSDQEEDPFLHERPSRIHDFNSQLPSPAHTQPRSTTTATRSRAAWAGPHHRLTEAICGLIDDYSMVAYIPLNIQDEESIDAVMAHVDHTVQYGENLEVQDYDLDLTGEADQEEG